MPTIKDLLEEDDYVDNIQWWLYTTGFFEDDIREMTADRSIIANDRMAGLTAKECAEHLVYIWEN